MKLKFTFLFYLFSLHLSSQGIDNLWLMGYDSYDGYPYAGINLNFKSGQLVIDSQERKMNFEETNGEICDKNGNLLFCSDGVWIANTLYDTMRNGSGLNPNPLLNEIYIKEGLIVDQGNIIIPLPDDTSKYYLFHMTNDDYENTNCSLYLYYSIIDMSLEGGLGAVIQKNIILKSDSLVSGRLTACKHANGRDWWLIAHQFHSNRYYKYLITPYGIDSPIVQDIGVYRDTWWGQCSFSPNGGKYAYYEPWIYDLDIFDFDRCTGEFSNPIHVNFTDTALLGGVAFSPNSKVLYVSSDRYVYQFDLTDSDVSSTQKTVAIWDGYYSPSPPLATTFYLSEIAPDGKIYIICGNGTLDIHVINNPDSLGSNCNVCQHCVHLPGFNGMTIANHPNYFLGAEHGTICDSLESVQSFSVRSSELEVYPNPVVSDEITFAYNVSSEKGIITIYNIEGKEIAQYYLPQWSSVQHLKLPKLGSGIYLARLKQGNAISSTKFVKE